VKKWYKSKTLLVNVGVIAVLILQDEAVRSLMDPILVAKILAVVNLALRIITTTKLTMAKKKKEGDANV